MTITIIIGNLLYVNYNDNSEYTKQLKRRMT